MIKSSKIPIISFLNYRKMSRHGPIKKLTAALFLSKKILQSRHHQILQPSHDASSWFSMLFFYIIEKNHNMNSPLALISLPIYTLLVVCKIVMRRFFLLRPCPGDVHKGTCYSMYRAKTNSERLLEQTSLQNRFEPGNKYIHT